MKVIALTAFAAAVLATGAAAAATPVASAPGLVVSQGGEIYVGGKMLANGTQPTWSRDGSQIAFVRNGEIHVVADDGTNDRKLTARKAGLHWPANSPAWSPDGESIAFSGTRDIFTVRLADRKLTNLTHSQRSWIGNYTPAYSPNGKLIAFARNTDAFNSDIFLMTLHGKIVKRLTHSVGTDSTLGEEHGPSWSPDGRTLVYVSNRGQKSWELYTIRADGKGERQLTNTPTPRYDEDAPRYIENGARILYAHDGRIATIDADGTGVAELGLGTSADSRA
jgi:Tol biopolymer transport system component